jgi:hypothetical protein
MHYRLDPTDPAQPCLPYPAEPKNLTLYYLDQASVRLRWNLIDPASSYDIAQIRYKLDCYKCASNATNRQQKKCIERQPCESYIQIDMTVPGQVSLKSLDPNTPYLIELYAHHAHNLFRTRTVDMLVRTSDVSPTQLPPRNLTAYQFVDLNQIIVLWSTDQRQTTSIGEEEEYEIRYWPLGFFNNKANVLSIAAPASNFTFRNANPSILAHNLYVFQVRVKRARAGWSAFAAPVEAVKIVNNNNLFYSLMKGSGAAALTTVLPSAASSLLYNQLIQQSSSSASSVSSSKIAITHQLNRKISVVFSC